MARAPAAVWVAFIDYIALKFGNVLFYALVLLGSVAIVLVSILLSIRFMNRRGF